MDSLQALQTRQRLRALKGELRELVRQARRRRAETRAVLDESKAVTAAIRRVTAAPGFEADTPPESPELPAGIGTSVARRLPLS